MAFRRPRSALASLLGRGDGAASSRSTQSTRSLSTGSATTNGKHAATGGSHDVLSVHETQPSLFYFAVYQVDGVVSMETSGSSSPIAKLSASSDTAPESTTATSSSPSPPPNDDERADRANRAEDTREAERILCFYPPTFDRNDQLRQIGLARALANFSRNFDRMGGRIEHARVEHMRSGIENVHSQKHRMVFFEPEPGYGMLLNVNLGCIIQTVRVSGGMNTAGAAGQRTIVEFLDSSVSDAPLHEVLVSGYECFRLLHGSFAHIVRNHGGKVEELRQRLEAFYTRYLESSLELDRPFTFQQTLNGMMGW